MLATQEFLVLRTDWPQVPVAAGGRHGVALDCGGPADAARAGGPSVGPAMQIAAPASLLYHETTRRDGTRRAAVTMARRLTMLFALSVARLPLKHSAC
jgi:hypothetical protein